MFYNPNMVLMLMLMETSGWWMSSSSKEIPLHCATSWRHFTLLSFLTRFAKREMKHIEEFITRGWVCCDASAAVLLVVAHWMLLRWNLWQSMVGFDWEIFHVELVFITLFGHFFLLFYSFDFANCLCDIRCKQFPWIFVFLLHFLFLAFFLTWHFFPSVVSRAQRKKSRMKRIAFTPSHF